MCTLSPLDAALTMRFAKNTQHATSKVLRLPRKLQRISENVAKVLRLPHTQRLSTHYETRLNVTKCHACHAKRSYATLETSKSDPFCRTYHRHGHAAPTRTVADGCEWLRTVADVNATSSARPPEWNGNPWYAFGENGTQFQCLSSFYQSININVNAANRFGTYHPFSKISRVIQDPTEDKPDHLHRKVPFRYTGDPHVFLI